MPDSTPLSTPSPHDAPRATQPQRRRWWLWVFGGLLAFVLIVVATVAITIWWIQRPIKPVVLSAPEKAVVDAKLQTISAGRNERLPSPSRVAPSPNPSPI